MDDGVRLEHRFGVDPRRPRVDDRHARQHVGLVDPVPERCARCCHFCPRVHALRLHRILPVHCDPSAILHDQRDRVRQVQLALRVLRREPLEHRPERVGPEHVDRGVDLTYSSCSGVASRASTIALSPPLPSSITLP